MPYARGEWLKVYDVPWVDNLVASVLVWLPEVEALMSKQEDKVRPGPGPARRTPHANIPRTEHLTPSIHLPPPCHLVQVYMARRAEDEEANASGAGKGTSKGTAFAPFNLSVSKPLPLPAPDLVPDPVRVKPVPRRREGPTPEEVAIAEVGARPWGQGSEGRSQGRGGRS